MLVFKPLFISGLFSLIKSASRTSDWSGLLDLLYYYYTYYYYIYYYLLLLNFSFETENHSIIQSDLRFLIHLSNKKELEQILEARKNIELIQVVLRIKGSKLEKYVYCPV